MVFNSAGTADAHVAKRIDKCRRSFYALNDVGMGYPGCSASIKSYLWKHRRRNVPRAGGAHL